MIDCWTEHSISGIAAAGGGGGGKAVVRGESEIGAVKGNTCKRLDKMILKRMPGIFHLFLQEAAALECRVA